MSLFASAIDKPNRPELMAKVNVWQSALTVKQKRSCIMAACPFCIKCAEAHEVKRKPPSPDRHVRTTLFQEFVEATARVNAASEGSSQSWATFQADCLTQAGLKVYITLRANYPQPEKK
jgi:hypothetical protein